MDKMPISSLVQKIGDVLAYFDFLFSRHSQLISNFIEYFMFPLKSSSLLLI